MSLKTPKIIINFKGKNNNFTVERAKRHWLKHMVKVEIISNE